MAIEVTSGRVVSIKTTSTIGSIMVEKIPPATPPLEIFLLYFADESHGPAAVWSTHLLTALAQNLPVRIAHDENSAFIEQVEVLAATSP
jgi:hypothetical protein